MTQIIDGRQRAGRLMRSEQKLMRRAQGAVKKGMDDAVHSRNIKDVGKDGIDVIVSGDLREHSFRHSSGGRTLHPLPGNKDHVRGDKIKRPEGGGGGGSEGSPQGDGQDEFRFRMPEDAFWKEYFKDLELPNLSKRREGKLEETRLRRAGFSSTGPAHRRDLTKTKTRMKSRTVAMTAGKYAELFNLLAEHKDILLRHAPERPAPIISTKFEPNAAKATRLKAELSDLTARFGAAVTEDEQQRIDEIDEAVETISKRIASVPYFVETHDERIRRFERSPDPVSQAVMFCLMDVSGSMTEHMKDLAKRWYVVMYQFLRNDPRYEKGVEIVFIRHTHNAQEVDEDTFFNSPETGGTVVSTALEEMDRVIADRYPPDKWDIYVSQASDGDNTPSDNNKTAHLVKAAIKRCQHFSYIEVGRDSSGGYPGFQRRDSDLWQTYQPIARSNPNDLGMDKISSRKDIGPAFRRQYMKRDGGAAPQQAAAFGPA